MMKMAHFYLIIHYFTGAKITNCNYIHLNFATALQCAYTALRILYIRKLHLRGVTYVLINYRWRAAESGLELRNAELWSSFHCNTSPPVLLLYIEYMSILTHFRYNLELIYPTSLSVPDKILLFISGNFRIVYRDWKTVPVQRKLFKLTWLRPSIFYPVWIRREKQGENGLFISAFSAAIFGVFVIHPRANLMKEWYRSLSNAQWWRSVSVSLFCFCNIQ